MALTSVGIGSGLDIGGIVTALVDAESAAKIAKFDVTEGTITSQISAIGSLKSTMSAFNDTLETLMEADTFGSQKVAVSTTDYLSATVESTAVSGSYQVRVEQLAQSQKVSSGAVVDSTSTIGTGSLAIAVGSNSFNIDVEAADTLTEIMNKINSSDDNDDVTATIISGESGPQLVLGSKNTGLDNTISVTATDTDGNTGLVDTFTMTEVTAAQDAIVYVDGVKVVSSTNEIEEAITGVTLNLTASDVDETTTLTVSRDTTKTKTAIEGFVEAYNSVMTTIQSLTSYDADTEQAGILQGDSLPRSIQSQMRNMLSSQYSTSDGNKMLATLGITTTTSGLLEIDSDKLTESIADDTGAIAEMFSTEDTGLASKMSSLMDGYVQSGGIMDSRDSSLDDQLSRLDDSREQLNTRMEAYSTRLYAQYNAMDLVVANLNSTAEDIQSRLDSLPGVVSDN